MYKLFIVESNKSPLYFYGVTRKTLYKKMNMLHRNWRVKQEGRLNHSPNLRIFPDVSISLVETHDTRQEANKRIEELRNLNPEECLNRPSTIYGNLKEYKKKKNKEKIFCNYCQKHYSKDYWAEHLKSMKHINNLNLPVD